MVGVSVGVGVIEAVTVDCGVGVPGGVSETIDGGRRVESPVGVGDGAGVSVSNPGVGVPVRLGARDSKTIPKR